MAKMTRGERVIAFAERYLVVPEGDHVGKPIILEDFQKKFILDIYDNPYITDTAILSMARKNAKALALDTPIPTLNGWKTMKDISIGDYVYGTDGKPVKVIAESEIFTDKECYKVSFSDGTEIIASADHVWTTKHKISPITNKHAKNRYFANVTTEQISKTLYVRRNDETKERNHSVLVASSIIGQSKEIPFNPYLLGYWLGDGKSTAGILYVSDQDINNLIEKLNEIGIKHSIKKDKTVNNVYLHTSDGSWHDNRINSFIKKLKENNLYNNKHIPDVYFNCDVEIRLKLLQGLMDTDGSVNSNGGKSPRCVYVSVNYTLAYDVWRLVRSLGLKAKLNTRKAVLNGVEICNSYHVEFTATKSNNVFSLERKNNKLKDGLGERSKSIQIVSCDPIGIVPCKCIAVDSDDHLFLAGHGCIPTHNTATIAIILCAHLIGPEARTNSRIVSGALSRDQAAEVYNLSSKMLNLNPELEGLYKIIPSGKKIIGLAKNVEYQAISAEAKTSHGKSPVLAILDEVGQIKGPSSDFVDAITTAQGAYDDALLIYISTQSATDSDFFSIQIDDALEKKPKKTVCHLYATPDDADLLDEKSWYLSNPALGKFRSLNDMRKQAEKASRMPSFESTFRNLNLNQRVEVMNPFVTKEIWGSNSAKPDSLEGKAVYAGLDLSSSSDLTAFVMVSEDGDVVPLFWLPQEGLSEKSKSDRVPYDIWAKEGYLLTTRGKSIEYEYVAEYLRGVFDKYDIKAVAFDRYNMKFLKPWLEKVGFSIEELELFKEFGQGFVSMSPALRELESRLLQGKLKHGNHPILNMCSHNAKIINDSTGNRKFDKREYTSRIDGMVALAMAVGVMPLAIDETPEYQMFFV